MTRQTHDIIYDHFGVLADAQIAGGSASSGDAPISNGDGTRTWGVTTITDAQIAGGTAILGDVPVSNGDGTRTWAPQSGGGGGGSGAELDVQLFTATGDGTWSAPSVILLAQQVTLLGGGGGGAGGSKSAASQLNLGGCGGAAGGETIGWFNSPDIPFAVSLHVGAGGAGGSGATASDTNGSGGSDADDSWFGGSGASSARLVAGGGAGGQAGGHGVVVNSLRGARPGSGNIGLGGLARVFTERDGLTAWSVAQAATMASGGRSNDTDDGTIHGSSAYPAGGGGAGGATTSGNLTMAGGKGGVPADKYGLAGAWAAPAGGTSPGGNGADGTSLADETIPAGFGAGGGGSRISGASVAGNGGAGGLYGGGGGGGGAGRNSAVDGGAGGAGGAGAIRVMTWYEAGSLIDTFTRSTAYGLGSWASWSYAWSNRDSSYATAADSLFHCDGTRLVVPGNLTDSDSYILSIGRPPNATISLDVWLPAIDPSSGGASEWLPAMRFHAGDASLDYGIAFEQDYSNTSALHVNIGVARDGSPVIGPTPTPVSVAVTPGAWHTFKVEYVTGGNVNLKMWPTGTSEPGWLLTATNGQLESAFYSDLWYDCVYVGTSVSYVDNISIAIP